MGGGQVKRRPAVIKGIEARTQRRFGVSAQQLGELVRNLD